MTNQRTPPKRKAISSGATVCSSADDLAEWVKSGRESMRMPQSDLAKIVGISIVQISKIENGHAQTTLETLRKMCGVFGKPFVVDWE
jgi:transcriptional regulator with XRE-family HTH domain